MAIAELVALFLKGLKERSVFTMAIQDRKATGACWGFQGILGLVERRSSHIHKNQSRTQKYERHNAVGSAFGKASI